MDSGRSGIQADWARTGFRRGLANYPWFVDAKSGDIVVTERDNHRLQIFDSFGNETRFEPFGTRGPRTNQFINPGGVTTSSILGAGIIVADTGNKRVCTYRIGSDRHGYGIVDQTNDFGQHVFVEPTSVEIDRRRNTLAVTDPAAHRVTLHDMQKGELLGECRPKLPIPMLAPTDIAIDEIGRIYVTDANSHVVHVFDQNGLHVDQFGGPGFEPGQLNKPWGICFDREFNLLVADEGNNRVQMFSPSGQFLKIVASNILSPKGVSVNAHEKLVLTCGEPYGFLKIIKYK